MIIYPLFIFFGVTPSIIWLLFYLRKDVHPESNKMVLKIFFYGMLAAVLAGLIEIYFAGVAGILISLLSENLPISILSFIFYHFLIVALVEELSKYLIVKEKVVNDPEFDEPVDAMLYMIIVALGFAALENTLYLLPARKLLYFGDILKTTAAISFLRFFGATFLHALCSGTIGYFLALSFFEPKRRFKLILKGVGIAMALHALFNISIMGIEGGFAIGNYLLSAISLIFVILILSGLAFFVSHGFKKLKKIASICKL